MNRRNFIHYSAMGIAALSLWPYRLSAQTTNPTATPAGIMKIIKKDEEWKKELDAKAYHVLRDQGTEAPFSSPLLKEHREGTFICKACELPLFSSATKYDSGTGWPSFFKAIEKNIETSMDYKLIAPRTEYHCARCDGHQGHVFDDGPQPTGLRYCNNGVALKFIVKG